MHWGSGGLRVLASRRIRLWGGVLGRLSVQTEGQRMDLVQVRDQLLAHG